MKAKTMSVFLFALLVGGTIQAHPVQPSSPSPLVTLKNRANNAFGMFMAHRQGKGVSLSWTVAMPSEVAYYGIQRSYDGEFFETIYDMPGNSSSRCRYSDKDVYPGVIHYRIVAFNNDGSIIESAVESVRIVSRK
ncbi:MAG: hypothetical protein MUE58_13390 [Chitinophagaceae bacterium]|nr:hypothetical protein [Chitinophagaceae bacterium]